MSNFANPAQILQILVQNFDSIVNALMPYIVIILKAELILLY
jgi:hypothetical protein